MDALRQGISVSQLPPNQRNAGTISTLRDKWKDRQPMGTGNIYSICNLCRGWGNTPVKPKRTKKATRDPPPRLNLRHRSWCGQCNSTGKYLRGDEGEAQCRVRGMLHGRNVYNGADLPVVAINGGGIAGSALALALQHRGMKALVFERDNCFDSRRQGYGLTMQQGRNTLRQLGIELNGISSFSHYSFTDDGKIIGKYGREITFRGEKMSGHKHVRDLISYVEEVQPPGEHEGDTAFPKAKSNPNVHIPRQHLRKRLIEAVDPQSIYWGTSVESFEDILVDGKHKVQIRLSNGESKLVDVLVGADGINSTIRQQLVESYLSSAESPVEERTTTAVARDTPKKAITDMNYLGYMVVLGIAPCIHPVLSKRISQTMDGTSRIYTMPFSTTDTVHQDVLFTDDGPDDSSNASSAQCEDLVPDPQRDMHRIVALAKEKYGISELTMWQLSYPLCEDVGHAWSKDSDKLMSDALERCGNWHEPIPELLRATPISLVSGYPLYDRDPLPLDLFQQKACVKPLSNSGLAQVPAESSKIPFPGDSSHRRSRVTLVGDAAHPMSPFKGQGANQALLDALLLARLLFDSEIGWHHTKLLCTKGEKGCGTVDCLCNTEAFSDQSVMCLSDALTYYEEEMSLRSSEKVFHSRVAATLLHSPAALQEINAPRARSLESSVNSQDVLSKQ